MISFSSHLYYFLDDIPVFLSRVLLDAGDHGQTGLDLDRLEDKNRFTRDTILYR